MKTVQILAVLLALLAGFSLAEAAKNPVRVARLPIAFQNYRVDKDTRAILETKLARATNIPLNGTLKTAEFISAKDSNKKFDEIFKRYSVANGKSSISESVKILAKELKADIVIFPLIRRYSESVTPSTRLNGETQLKSYVAAEIIVYDRRTGKLTDEKTSRSYNNSYNRYGTASSLAGNCFDELISKSKIREIILAIR